MNRLFPRIAAVLLASAVLAAGVNHLVLWQIEHRLNLKIQKKPWASFLPGTILLNGSFVDWDNRLKLEPETLAVRYPLAALFWRDFSISLQGRNLAVTFGEALRKTIGSKQVVFDEVRARLRISSEREVRIESLDADSKTIQFHLKGKA